jgi:hypothetical protein
VEESPFGHMNINSSFLWDMFCICTDIFQIYFNGKYEWKGEEMEKKGRVLHCLTFLTLLILIKKIDLTQAWWRSHHLGFWIEYNTIQFFFYRGMFCVFVLLCIFVTFWAMKWNWMGIGIGIWIGIVVQNDFGIGIGIRI